jgi:hypothetical protein
MKHIAKSLAAILVATVLITACKKEFDGPEIAQEEISSDVLAKIKALGFGTGSVQKVEDGYLVEGDILLTDKHLNKSHQNTLLRVGDEEQYRTSNTVLGLPRTILVNVSTTLPAWAVTATDAAIARYNVLANPIYGINATLIKFQRTTGRAHIYITPAPSGAGYLASAGFPTDAGHPFSSVRVNAAILNTWASNTRTSIIAHELGHCIGFRHTDYMNRSYSCGGAPVNEGAGAIGAKHIPGTPTTPDAGSWMLACIGNGVNRPFTANDIRALRWLY